MKGHLDVQAEEHLCVEAKDVDCGALGKVGIPNFVSGPREYIMEGEYVILAMCSWFRIR